MVATSANVKDQEMKDAQIVAASPAAARAFDASKETTGERYFRIARFWVAEAFILGVTAAIAYTVRYGEGNNPVTKKLKDWSTSLDRWFVEKLGGDGRDNGMGGFEKQGLFPGNERVRSLGSNLADTTVTFHGGNVFAPVLYFMERKKESFVTYFNEKFGKEGEVEIGKARVQAEGTPSLFTVIKGRIASFLTVFTAFSVVDQILWKDENGTNRFGKYQDGFARLTSRAAGNAEPSRADLPLGKHEGTGASKSYLFGKILSLDVFATTMAVSIWTTVNKFLSKKHAVPVLVATPVVEELRNVPEETNVPSDESVTAKFAEREQKRTTENRVDAVLQKKSDSHVEAQAVRAAHAQQSVMVGV